MKPAKVRLDSTWFLFMERTWIGRGDRERESETDRERERDRERTCKTKCHYTSRTDHSNTTSLYHHITLPPQTYLSLSHLTKIPVAERQHPGPAYHQFTVHLIVIVWYTCIHLPKDLRGALHCGQRAVASRSGMDRADCRHPLQSAREMETMHHFERGLSSRRLLDCVTFSLLTKKDISKYCTRYKEVSVILCILSVRPLGCRLQGEQDIQGYIYIHVHVDVHLSSTTYLLTFVQPPVDSLECGLL